MVFIVFQESSYYTAFSAQCSAGSGSTCHCGKCQGSIYFSGELFMPQSLNVAEERFFRLEGKCVRHNLTFYNEKPKGIKAT